MNSQEAVERALRKIQPAPAPEELTPLRSALLVSINSALRTVAELMAQRAPEDVERQLLETTAALTLAAGVGNLAAWVSANPSYLTKTIDRGKIFHGSSSYPLQEVADELQLTFPWPAELIYFCISGDKLKTRNKDQSLTSLTGDLTITLLAIPTLANLPAQLEPLLIEAMVAEIASGQNSKKTKKPS